MPIPARLPPRSGRESARVLPAALAVLPLILAACAPPVGRGSGRVENSQTTRAERHSDQVSTDALTEFSDDVAAQITADLKTVPELNKFQATIILGDLDNKTGIVPTSDFEAFRSRIRQKLMQSHTVLQNVRFVESLAKIQALQRREGADGATPALNKEYTFFLNGEMYRVERGGTSLYNLSFNLMRMSDGTVVWSHAGYEVKQVR